MRKHLMYGGILLILCGVSGCGGADSVMQDHIKNMNDVAEAIETKASQDKVNEAKKKLEQSGKKLEELKLSEEEKKKLVEKHKDELTKATARLGKAMMGEFGKMFEAFPGMPNGGGMPGIPSGGKQ